VSIHGSRRFAGKLSGTISRKADAGRHDRHGQAGRPGGLDRDYFTIPDRDTKIRSLLTIVDGRIVHNDGVA